MNFQSLIVFLSPSAEKKKAGLFEQITKTHGTIIGVTSGIVLVLLIISILVQVKQPRKKVMACKTAFNKTSMTSG